MMMVGFDPASYRNLGWCSMDIKLRKDFVSSFEIEAGTYVSPVYPEPWQDLYPIMETVEQIIQEKSPKIVILEKTSAFSGSFITGQVSNCIGVILAMCGKHDIDVGMVLPTHCKKVLTGKGNASKKELKDSIKKQLAVYNIKNAKFDSHHAWDAVGNVLTWLTDNSYKLAKAEDLEG